LNADLVAGGAYGEWDYVIYKGSLCFEDYYYFPGKGLYTQVGLYYSTTGNDGVTAYTEALLPLVYDTSGGTGGGSSDSLGIDTDANGTIDNWLYGTDGLIGMLKEGANVVFTVTGDTLTISGPSGSGTADSVGVDTSGDGVIDCKLYGTSGYMAVLKEGSGAVLTVVGDSVTLSITEDDPALEGATITLGPGTSVNENIVFYSALYGLDSLIYNHLYGVLSFSGDIYKQVVTGDSVFATKNNIQKITHDSVSNRWDSTTTKTRLDDSVTYEVLNGKGDVGTSAGQLAIGNHAHTGVYAPVTPDSTEIDTANIREWVADKIGGMVTGNTETNITVTYDDADNTLDFVASGSVGSDLDLDSLSADTIVVNTVLKVPGNQTIDNDTSLVSEGELEDSLDGYPATAVAQDLIHDSIVDNSVLLAAKYFDMMGTSPDSVKVLYSDSTNKALKDASGNTITTTYETITKVALIGDDTTAFKLAKDSVADWDNGALDSTNLANDGVSIDDIQWRYEYISLTVPSGRGITADSMALLPFWRDFLFRDSTWQGSDEDTAWVSGSIPYGCVVESLIFVYRCDAGAEIDSINMYGPDISNAVNGTDSLYYSADVALTSSSLARVAYYVNEASMLAGYRFKAEFINLLPNDNDYIDVKWVQLCIKR
jgi:hypothetical protein